MFDLDFCQQLEYAISGALTKSADIDWRRCWCDSVLLPDNEADYSLEQILHRREVLTRAWIDSGRIKGGKTRGQSLYDMLIIFGDNSLNKIKTGNRLETCIPDAGADSWIHLDRENRTISIQLT